MQTSVFRNLVLITAITITGSVYSPVVHSQDVLLENYATDKFHKKDNAKARQIPLIRTGAQEQYVTQKFVVIMTALIIISAFVVSFVE